MDTNTTLDVSVGTLKLRDDQINGDKINDGTIGITIVLAGAMDCNSQSMTNVNIDSGAIDAATIGSTIASTDFTTITASGTITGSSDIDGSDLTMGTITMAGFQLMLTVTLLNH